MKTYDTARTGASLRARQLRRDSTGAEKKLWVALRKLLPGTKFRRQMPIGPYFADFACFAARLVIELDGGQHTPETDAARTRFIEAHGYRVLRVWNNDVSDNIAGVVETIAAALHPPLPVGEGRGEGDAGRRKGKSSSPSQPSAGSLPLPMGEEK